jgi:hypothetical protein
VVHSIEKLVSFFLTVAHSMPAHSPALPLATTVLSIAHHHAALAPRVLVPQSLHATVDVVVILQLLALRLARKVLPAVNPTELWSSFAAEEVIAMSQPDP